MSYEEMEFEPFEDSDFEDEDQGCDYWTCVKCNKEFIDPEEFPNGWKFVEADIKLEVQLYWLGVNEPVCSHCAAKAGIPPVDEGDE